ncbi:hypothetical protein [Halomonas aquatica]|uniref:Uncharacterized protein n=1 Tax=Halomonas aquatica TaxID=3151123 RepID=A0ABV1NG58_9GAMM
MSLRDLLRRRQAVGATPAPCPPSSQGAEKAEENQPSYSGSTSSLATAKGGVRLATENAANDPEPPGPEADIDLILENLSADFTGAPLHEIDHDLAGVIRRAMLPMGRRARAELEAVIDDELTAGGREQVLALLQQRIKAQPPSTWLAWIEQECPLVDGDVEFIDTALTRLEPREQAARRYVDVWQAAAEAEAEAHRKPNVGRQAANQTLLPASSRPMVTSSTRQPVTTTTTTPSLPAGVRMAWTIRVGDKRLMLAGRPYTREEAQQSVQARWPEADVEVVE